MKKKIINLRTFLLLILISGSCLFSIPAKSSGQSPELNNYNIIWTTQSHNSSESMPCGTFWGPGHDWIPDHNWGGSGMIGLQEMLMQTD